MDVDRGSSGEALEMDDRTVARCLPISLSPHAALEIVERVPFWFHVFDLTGDSEVLTPGVGKGHGYRMAFLPERFDGLSVLDVGAFDGFYSFLAEARGAARVLAIDNEQYVDWVRSGWGVDLGGGEGFSAIGRALDSQVEYRRVGVEALALDEMFDFIICFGMLHRVENPLGVLRVLSRHLKPQGVLLVETYGLALADRPSDPLVKVVVSGETYSEDDAVYWHFSMGAIERMGASFSLRRDGACAATVGGHPRVVLRLVAD